MDLFRVWISKESKLGSTEKCWVVQNVEERIQEGDNWNEKCWWRNMKGSTGDGFLVGGLYLALACNLHGENMFIGIQHRTYILESPEITFIPYYGLSYDIEPTTGYPMISNTSLPHPLPTLSLQHTIHIDTHTYNFPPVLLSPESWPHHQLASVQPVHTKCPHPWQ